MTLFLIFEYCTFVYFPLQKALVIDRTGRTMQEKVMIDAGENLYQNLIINKKSYKGQKNFSVSYMDVLRLPEFRIFMVAGGLK